jgi:hypothetical protein
MDEKLLSSSPTSVAGFFGDRFLCRSIKQRRVRFAASSQYIENPFILNEESNDEQETLWWSRDDMQSIMTKALLTANEARKHAIVAKALDQAVRRAEETASLVFDQFGLDTLLLDLRTEDRALRLWCQYGHSRRGLEKYTSRLYHQQRKCLIKTNCSQVVSLSIEGADPELIRQVAERTSRPSVILARMMGIADSTAAASCHPGIDVSISIDGTRSPCSPQGLPCNFLPNSIIPF